MPWSPTGTAYERNWWALGEGQVDVRTATLHVRRVKKGKMLERDGRKPVR
jgi:hypothetical protein